QTDASNSGGVGEIVVTATKRSESLQKVPIAVQAMGGETLSQLGVTNTTDIIAQMPNVTAGGGGPGQNTIYIRGLASTTPNLTTAGISGLAPNVATYLDEQPLSQPGRNLDVYAADLARVEVLAGPQGTLFGASSQAGVVRFITNDPKLGSFEGSVKAGVAFTKGGDMSVNAQSVMNLPVTDTLAVRSVVYIDHQGGYIDNVHGTRSVADNPKYGGVVPPGVTMLQADNSTLVEDNINSAEYRGFRVTALWEPLPDWSLKVAHTRQGLETDGVFSEDPTLGDYKIQRFTPEKTKDNFSNTAWTVEGRLGALEMVYTGSYLERETKQRVDYTDYLFTGPYIPYYLCDVSVVYPSYVGATDPAGTCQAPNLYVNSNSKLTGFTQELRFNTPAENRFRVTAGGFYSNQILKERNDFVYPGSIQTLGADGVTTGFLPNYPLTNTSVTGEIGSAAPGYYSDPGPFPAGVIFRNDAKRTDKQFGFFGEASFDVVPDVLTATFGARYYNVSNDLEGSANSSFGNRISVPGGIGTVDRQLYGTNLSQKYSGNNPGIPGKFKEDGVIFKGTVSVTPVRNVMFYATYSEGFRPGLLNRPGGAVSKTGTYTVPYAVDSDTVTNYEIGWKTKLFDNQLIFNGSAFYVKVKGLQTSILDPNITNLFFSDNAADARTQGIEGEFTFAPYAVEGLTLSGAFSFIDTKITRKLVPTDYVRVGDDLAYAPKFQGNLRARYEWDLGSSGLRAHVMPGMIHSGSKQSDVIVPNRTLLKGYTTFSLAAGVAKDNWSIELFGDNLTNKAAQTGGDAVFKVKRAVVARPLTVGMRVSFNY
ncbi:TonB-dependent receptor, partial [Novosphingobium beihaiensis]